MFVPLFACFSSILFLPHYSSVDAIVFSTCAPCSPSSIRKRELSQVPKFNSQNADNEETKPNPAGSLCRVLALYYLALFHRSCFDHAKGEGVGGAGVQQLIRSSNIFSTSASKVTNIFLSVFLSSRRIELRALVTCTHPRAMGSDLSLERSNPIIHALTRDACVQRHL